MLMTEAFDPSQFLPRPDVAHINERGADFARREIKKYSGEIIDLVYAGVSAYLEADKAHTDEINALIIKKDADEETVVELPKGEIFGVYVKQDTIMTAPWKDGEPVRTFCTRLEPPEQIPQYDDTLEQELNPDDTQPDTTEIDPTDDVELEDIHPELPEEPPREDDHRYMKIHVPVGRLSIFDFKMPEHSEIAEVFIEAADGDDVRWYAVRRNGHVYEYLPDFYEDDKRQKALTKREWRQFMKRGVPELHDTVTSLLEHIVDWPTVPQNIRVIK